MQPSAAGLAQALAVVPGVMFTGKYCEPMISKRSQISILCWFFSSLAIGYSFISIQSAIYPPTWFPDRGVPERAWDVVGHGYSWLALLIMNLGWILKRKVHRYLVISGTAVASAMALHISYVFTPFSLFWAASTICLAMYLVAYHLEADDENSEQT